MVVGVEPGEAFVGGYQQVARLGFGNVKYVVVGQFGVVGVVGTDNLVVSDLKQSASCTAYPQVLLAVFKEDGKVYVVQLRHGGEFPGLQVESENRILYGEPQILAVVYLHVPNLPGFQGAVFGQQAVALSSLRVVTLNQGMGTDEQFSVIGQYAPYVPVYEFVVLALIHW